MNLKNIFKKPETFRVLDGYSYIKDGYVENPLAHYKNATSTEIENEYYMQWVDQLRLQRIALRTPIGYRLTHLYAKDLWNNRIGIKIENDDKKAKEINKKLVEYLISRHWFREAKKLTGFYLEQGESIMICYDGSEIKNFKYPMSDNKQILRVEAFSPIDYYIRKYDKYGDPELYAIKIKSPNSFLSYETVDVHASRVIRLMGDNIEFRETGLSKLNAVYDSLVILSSIVKSSGEAAFRWATGRPTFLTQDINNEADLEKIQAGLQDFSRKAWIMLPSEKIKEIQVLGQAGSMLNLKSLADICIDQIVAGTGFPKTILLGEIQGVMGSEVQERAYFALLDRDHTEIEYFVKEYFKKDVNIRKLLLGIENYTINWGIREVFNKMDDAEYQQKMVSIAIAMTQISTVNEAREKIGLKKLSDEKGGDVILGLLPYIELQAQLVALLESPNEPEDNVHGEGQTNTSMKEKSNSTSKKAASLKEAEKNKRVAPPTRDSIEDVKKQLADSLINLREEKSMNQIQDQLHIHPKTYYKLLEWAKKQQKMEKK